MSEMETSADSEGDLFGSCVTEPEVTIEESQTSLEISDQSKNSVLEVSQDGDTTQEREMDVSQDSQDSLSESKGEALSSESADDSTTAKTSRELKSILALSKEAKLDTNLTQRRKTLDKAKTTPKKNKMTDFPVTAESELENLEVKTDEKKAKKQKVDTEGATSDEARRGGHVITGDFIMARKPNKDIFCWRCHHDSVQVACETCPRAYHLRCLKQTITDPEHWPCPECVLILKSENTQTRSKAMRGMTLEHLCGLLKFAVKRMIQCSGSEPFMHPVDEKQFPEYKSYIVQPMTLTMLEKNIKENSYGSTQAFEADAKWILHNSIIFNSYQSKLTSAAKTIVKICKQEMAEVENCPSCYLNANTKKNSWFVEVCPKPHLLVWAKLKGFPYWPAKVMSVNSSGMADVRFFGAHDKAWVSVKECYLYSVKDPNSGKQKRNDIAECVKELDLYVDNLRKIYGRVNLAPFKTPLEPDSQLKQIQVFLPNYKNDGKEVLWKPIDESLLKAAEESSSSEEESEVESSEEEEEEEEDEDEEETKKKKIGKTNGDKLKEGMMKRIDYGGGLTESSPISKPIKAIVIRKRFSADKIPDGSTKIMRKEMKSDLRLSVDNHVKFSQTESKNSIQDDTDQQQKVAKTKLRISDELIKKLEDESDKEEETKNTESKSEEPEEKEEAPSENKIETDVKIIENDKKDDEEKKDEKEEVEKKDAETKEAEKIEDKEVEEKAKSPEKNEKPPSPEKEVQKTEDKPVSKKRKLEDKKDNDKNEDNLFPPNKMVKLVPIENILQKKDLNNETTPTPEKSEQLIVLKEIRVVKDGKEVKAKKKPDSENGKEKESPVKVKNEVESDEDNDVQYMEAKRQYLSALNISEKQKNPTKPKTHEIRTRSKTEEKKSKKEEMTRQEEAKSTNAPKSAEHKEIYIKSLSKMQTPKHKARKSFPTPNYSKKTIVARKLVPKPTADDELTIVNATTLQPTGNVMILPKLHYTKPIISRDMSSPPVLAMLPRPQLETPPNKKIPEGSQNYIPQSEDAERNGTNANVSSGALLNNLLTGGNTQQTPIIDLESPSNAMDGDLGSLKEILPETVAKGVNDILCQPPPKLKPKPVGILNSAVEAGVPSTAGPVASRINSMAQKLSDCFRSLLLETINDLGKSNNPEATISTLKYEIEELNHKHSIELAEIRRNVSIVLKDIQKSVVEERERIINETKANCEMEAMKKVEEAKSKQWCANCLKEAQFYCCWNTSYCDYPCQQKHWPKHMSKCSQTSGQNQTAPPAGRPAGQQLVLTPTTAPKFGTLFAKPQKVYLKRTGTPFKPATGSHITLVESTPGNFELLGSGPIAVNGKILASTSVIEKIKSGNIVTVTAPSGATNTQLTSVNQKVNPIAKNSVNTSNSEH